jgi:uncharacterized protein YbaR (Trm112 family)
MITATCPECKHLVNLVSMPEIGQQLKCVNCNEMLEVTWLLPLCLNYPAREDKMSAEQGQKFK